MSISQINIVPFDGRNHLHQSLGNQSETEVTSFKEILHKTTQRKTDSYINDMPPISKDQLMNIINNMNAHMNTKLMQALSMEINGEVDVPSSMHLMDRLNVSQTQAESNTSNKWHATPNNDIPDGGINLDRIIDQAAKTHGVEAALVKSVIKVESNFNSRSTSSKGAMGLMQLMPETARELGVQNPYDPVENVGAGTRYLKMLLNRYDGNVPLSLAAYNWGVGNIERRPDQMPTETKQYVDRVTNYYEMVKG
jgi:soluble lytic murein transglycosylase-like protein